MNKTSNPKDFLNENLFHSIIESHVLSVPFTITKIDNTPAVGVGENFLSTILKNKITIELPDGTTQQLSFISKFGGSATIDEDSSNKMNVFPRELEVYQTIIPAFEKIWKDIGGIDVIFGPKLYYAVMEPHKILIFEDLNGSDYKMLNRLEGLNEQQVSVVLEKLAKWHAASRIYVDQNEALNPLLFKGMLDSGLVEILDGYYHLMHSSLVECLNGCDDIDDQHLEIIKSWKDKIIPYLTKITKPDQNDFNILNHGDLWINNMMLLVNDRERATDVKFIDYQLGIYGSPALDILYFLTLSVHHTLFSAKFDEFIAYYHQQLIAALQQLKVTNIPTLKGMYETLLKNSFYGAMLLIEGVATVLIDHQRDDIDLKVYSQDSELGAQTRKKLFALSRTQEALKGLIQFYGKRGMLDR